MPTSFAEPLLTVDVERMQQMDTSSVETLFSMWSVFNRCADSMDQGRRYENMSWRLWNRQSLCAHPPAQFHHPPTRLDCTPRQSTRDLPQLSSSVDSASSEEYECVTASSHDSRDSPVTITGSRRPSTDLVLARSKPVPPHALERVVQSINDTKIHHRGDMTALAPSVAAAVRPLPTPASPTMARSPTSAPAAMDERKASNPRASHSSASTVPFSSPESSIVRTNTSGSETSAEFVAMPDVVRGFTPSSISQHRASSHASPRPEPMPIKSSLRPSADAAPAKQAKFMLGGSSEDESSSLEEQVARRQAKGVHAAHGVKQASFSDKVETRIVPGSRADDDEAAIASDDEDDVDESAIEEDDEEDDEEWDDYSDADEVPAAPQFARIDSTSRLASRRSLLTTGLHQSERESGMLGLATSNAAAAAAAASSGASGIRRSRTSSPNGPSLATSMEEESAFPDADAGLTAAAVGGEPLSTPMQGIKITRTKPPTSAAGGGNAHLLHPPALSPRTTRRNMLATELTESLRKHLLWERQQKNTTANAHLKRRHTSHDVANLQNYPQQASSATSAAAAATQSRNNSWNDQIGDTGLGEYHSRGW